ncbi:TylF/MycF/NovP-related O-methyltransferase [Ensifer sp. LC163]|uniref:TylF/MycF/NovP-related O-methyltransferase n=1 Tax=Ensifer sp. LC163 TaxID=1120652 RepID=UPI000812C377|nr:TylF/MycF/NovP-related O-methyltransferase [Ensifer sp. LC163]OCP37484.1 hypothetical protein BC360_23255 [Ensifer sp. LC163]
MNDDKFLRTLVEYSTKHNAELNDYPINDIDDDENFYALFLKCRPYTMTSKEAMYALYKAVEYVVRGNLSGAFVECGVWKGGSALLAAHAFHLFERSAREIWLYDTFEGMSEPTEVDVDVTGTTAKQYMDVYGDDGKWCYAGLESVKSVFADEGLHTGVNFIQGDVVETLKHQRPNSISILRLDTDWYESTRAELEYLYDLVVPGGVLIFDDYGHWRGSRQAVDEFFSSRTPLYLQRIDPGVRLAIKR